jgi:hypothetical protein
MKLLAEFLEWKQVLEIISNKEYLKIPGVTNIGDYLEKLGLGRSVVYTNLKIARTLTIEEVRLFGQVGLTRRDLLGYASLPDEARMEIREGKVINIEKADREEIREIIEQILLENRQVKEEAESNCRAKERRMEDLNKDIQKLHRDIAKLEKKAEAKGLTVDEDAFQQRIEGLRKLVKGSFMGLEPGEVFIGCIDAPTTFMRALVVSVAHYCKMEALALYDTVVAEIGNPVMNPELLEEYERWIALNDDGSKG